MLSSTPRSSLNGVGRPHAVQARWAGALLALPASGGELAGPSFRLAAPALVAALFLLGAIAAVLAVRRHYRARMRSLLARLAQFEATGSLAEPQPWMARGSAGAGPEARGSAGPSAEEPPVADPLAGKTSHVRRMIEGSDSPAGCLADEAIVCTHRHVETSFFPADLARELNVSIRTLERGLASSLGCTPSQLILAVKMREARRLLLSGRFRVNEVALRLSFSTPQYFSRRFRSFFNLSPKELVRRHATRAAA